MFKWIKSIFCTHLWLKTRTKFGARLNKHKCLKCEKEIYRDDFNPPVSYIEN